MFSSFFSVPLRSKYIYKMYDNICFMSSTCISFGLKKEKSKRRREEWRGGRNKEEEMEAKKKEREIGGNVLFAFFWTKWPQPSHFLTPWSHWPSVPLEPPGLGLSLLYLCQPPWPGPASILSARLQQHPWLRTPGLKGCVEASGRRRRQGEPV